MGSEVHEEVHVLPSPVEVLDVEVVEDGAAGPLPWDLGVRIAALDREVTALDREVTAARDLLGSEYVTLWARFVALWRRYHRGHRAVLLGAWRGAFAWSDVHEQVAGFELRAAQWHRATEQRGVRLLVPELRRPRAAPPSPSASPQGVSILAAVRAAIDWFR